MYPLARGDHEMKAYFAVENGATYEVHTYEYENGLRWEKTVAGPGLTEKEAKDKVFSLLNTSTVLNRHHI